MKKAIFRSAITDGNGDVDVGYLALMWGLIGWGVSIAVVLGIAIWAVWRNIAIDVSPILSGVGSAIVQISGGFAAMLGAVGLFRYGDKPRAETAGFVTTTTQDRTTVQTQSPAIPLAAEVPALARGSPAKPLHVTLEEEPQPAGKAAAATERRPLGKLNRGSNT